MIAEPHKNTSTKLNVLSYMHTASLGETHKKTGSRLLVPFFSHPEKPTICLKCNL